MLFTSANKNEIKNYDLFSQQPSHVTCEGKNVFDLHGNANNFPTWIFGAIV